MAHVVMIHMINYLIHSTYLISGDFLLNPSACGFCFYNLDGKNSRVLDNPVTKQSDFQNWNASLDADFFTGKWQSKQAVLR